MSAGAQSERYPDSFVVIGDDIVSDYEEAIAAVDIATLPENVRGALLELDRVLESLAGDVFAGMYLSREGLWDPRWAQIRKAAKVVLRECGWLDLPVPTSSDTFYSR